MEVKVVAYSKGPNSLKPLVTFELEYPRFIHAELMTHRVFSRNGQSSRAVPLHKNLDHPVIYPITFGANKPGMSSVTPLSPLKTALCKALWGGAAYAVRASAFLLSKLGLHKQWVNRPLEWQQNIKVIVSSTEWDNFYQLRLDSKTVQPEMVQLAKLMKREMDMCIPEELREGEWHLPYIDTVRGRFSDELLYLDGEGQRINLEAAKTISASCCAQVSYRNLDKSYAKALRVVEMLKNEDDPHLSPFEHQATPMLPNQDPKGFWDTGTTHYSRDGNFWSGNFQGWIQNRQLMEKKQ